MEWIYQAPILFFSIIFHEFAHGYVAMRRGDDTAYLSGRLTFNPINHIDPIGTIVMPVLCYISGMPMFGWAKPVPVNPLRLEYPRRDMIKVSAAGPVSNLLLAAAAAVIMRVIVLFASALGGDMSVTLVRAMFFAVEINLVLAIFNLIPVAPLDGSKILGGLLPYKWAVAYEKHIPYGSWIILALILTGLVKWIIILPLSIAMHMLSFIGIPLY
jgi:Zn-dependent protease